MTFKIGDIVSKKITLEQLTAGLDKVKDKKKIDRITQIFNQYNTNTNGSSLNALDLDEQVALMNDLHRADGDGNGKDFDGKVSGRGLKKAGLAGEYKAYEDFIEAYQRAVAEDVNTYDLTFKDGMLDRKMFVETSAVQDGSETKVEHEYNDISGTTEKVRTTVTAQEGSFSKDQKGRLIRQVIGGTTIQYLQFDSDARNAKPGIVLIRENGSDTVQTLKLQEDGTYLNEADRTHYRLNRSGLLEEFIVDDKNRVTAEVWGKNNFTYAYEGEDTTPATVTLNKGSQGEVVFTREGELYTTAALSDDGSTEYYTFDSKKRDFKQTAAPEPQKQPEPVQKQPRPTVQRLIRMTQGWKNQKVNPDETTTAAFNNMSKADEVLAALVATHTELENASLNTDELLADLIKNNPSVFDAQGVIYSNARWDRLDFPKDLSRYKISE